MSSAYQCDRCGKLYTAKYNTLIELTKFNGEHRNIKLDCGLKPDLDLCPDCIESFKHWWDFVEDKLPVPKFVDDKTYTDGGMKND